MESNTRTSEIEPMINGSNQTVYVIRLFEDNKMIKTEIIRSYVIAEAKCEEWEKSTKW